jgi:hypothetical protein
MYTRIDQLNWKQNTDPTGPFKAMFWMGVLLVFLLVASAVYNLAAWMVGEA